MSNSSKGKLNNPPPFAYLYKHEVCEESDDDDDFLSDADAATGKTESISDFDISVPPHPLPGVTASYASGKPRDSCLSLGHMVHRLMLESLDEHGTSNRKSSIKTSNGRAKNKVTPGQKPNSSGHNVRFGNLYVREYQRSIGDTPCTAGPPISIGWKYRLYEKTTSKFSEKYTNGLNPLPKNAKTEAVVSVETYEQRRGPRGPVKSIILNRSEKEDLLIQSGFARSEIAEAVRQNIHVKNQRRQTVTNMKLAPVEEKFELWARSFRKLMVLDAKKRRESKSRHLFDQWIDDSGRGGSNRSANSYEPPDPSASLKGILIKDPEARRRQKKLESEPL